VRNDEDILAPECRQGKSLRNYLILIIPGSLLQTSAFSAHLSPSLGL
jgi:hypothetical protein